jgi:hypothetical protein
VARRGAACRDATASVVFSIHGTLRTVKKRARTSWPRSQVATYIAAVGVSPKPSVSQFTSGLFSVMLDADTEEAAGRVDSAPLRASGCT